MYKTLKAIVFKMKIPKLFYGFSLN